MQHATLETPEVSLHYVTQGEGPDVVWCPGGDQTGEEWGEQFDLLQGFRNVSFDPRGAGRTVSHKAPPWPIATYAADLATLIREVCKPPVVIVGLSMGALMVQEMLLSYPELCRFGIAMGTSGKKGGFLHDWEDAEVKFREAGGTLPPDFALAHYALLMYPSEVLGDDALWEKCKPVVAAAYAERDGDMLAAQWDACLKYSAMDRLPSCTRPLHVIGFEQDMQTPPARGRLVAEAAADGHFHLLKGMGHCSLFRHKPEAVSNKIREIIASHASRSSRVMPEVALVPATREDIPLVAALSRFYVYDIVRAVAPALDWPLTRDWLFDPGDWSFYWDGGNHPFLIEADGAIAGFCLIDHRAIAPSFDWNMGQFYVLGTMTGRGIGRRAATLAFDRFPGIWQVTQIPENLPAVAFWRATIAAYTGGNFTEQVLPDPQEEGDPRNVMLFSSPS